MYRLVWTAALTTAFLAAPPVLAEEAADDGVEDVTMEVMDEQAQSEAEFVDRIELPDSASDTARERAWEQGRGDDRRAGEAAREAAQTAREARRQNAPDGPEPPDEPDTE